MNKKILKKIIVRLSDETHKDVKRKVIDSEYKSMQELVVALLNNWLKKK